MILNDFKPIWDDVEAWSGSKLEKQWGAYLDEARQRWAASRDPDTVQEYATALIDAGHDGTVRREYARDDYTERAIALFTRFVNRHGFIYNVESDAPVELMWNIPAQSKLSLPIILGLQNEDELNFGVADFWSYFFPFDDVAERFERYLDMWVSGDARIVVTGRAGRVLQVRDGSSWKSVYGAGRLPFVWRKPRETVLNDPLYSNSTMT